MLTKIQLNTLRKQDVIDECLILQQKLRAMTVRCESLEKKLITPISKLSAEQPEIADRQELVEYVMKLCLTDELDQISTLYDLAFTSDEQVNSMISAMNNGHQKLVLGYATNSDLIIVMVPL